MTSARRSCHGATAWICIGLGIVVNRRGRHETARWSERTAGQGRPPSISPAKARKAPTAPVSIDHTPEQFDRLKRERDEALEQQSATSKVLGVISSSPTDVQPVFDLIAKSATRLCKAQFSHVFRFDGALIHFVALHGYSPEAAKEIPRGYPMAPGKGSAAARAILNGTVEEIPDILADHEYAHREFAISANFRSIVRSPC